jgi:hypothetical protein
MIFIQITKGNGTGVFPNPAMGKVMTWRPAGTAEIKIFVIKKASDSLDFLKTFFFWFLIELDISIEAGSISSRKLCLRQSHRIVTQQ